jgi:Tfp pilus assembly major pilin PilA
MRKQRGVTMIGWIFLLIPIAIVAYAGIRVGPEYFNYYKVVTALKDTAKQLEPDEAITANGIRGTIEKRFDTGYVDEPQAKDLVITRNEAGAWQVQADYEKTVPLFGNLFLTMSFEKTVVIN